MTVFEVDHSGGIYTVRQNGRVVAEGRAFEIRDAAVKSIDDTTFRVNGPNLVADERGGRVFIHGEFGGVSL